MRINLPLITSCASEFCIQKICTMEIAEFDVTLGGNEQLPYSANSLKFAASRSVEIAAMTESILRPSKTKLIFQTLPAHMRRRVMSHNCKRLPRKLRTGHMEQLKKSGLPPPQKRPSRKYRRRPTNLLEEYNRRQKRNMWLETHIWHAKRFHMIERWGHKLAYAPCDKAFRACYRATSAHCLLQDISYFTPIQITGSVENIKLMFSYMTNSSCGLGICAKAYVDGKREGAVHLYKPHTYPYGYIGKVYFIWLHGNDSYKSLWMFVHPSQAKEIETIITELHSHGKESNNCEEPNNKKRKLDYNYSSHYKNIEVKYLPGTFNRFRLTGPKSHAVLVHSLKCIGDLDMIKSNEWISSISKQNKDLYLAEKHKYWHNISNANSPSQLPQSIVIGLIVRDPRLSRPTYRTKAIKNDSEEVDIENLINIPPFASNSPIWDTTVHDIIKQNRKTNGQFIEHITNSQLIPGEVYLEDPALQSIPVVLIQRPGSQNANYKKIGYGSGWDIIVPSGYGLPFWQTFVMFGARAGGLRETESLAFEMGECHLPPDSITGQENDQQNGEELRDKYFKLPPSKRVNYTKLAINSPFTCPWKILLEDWIIENISLEKIYVLRNKEILNKIQDCIKKKEDLPLIEDAQNCLVTIQVQMRKKGNMRNHALICLPESQDLNSIKTLFEPPHEDPNTELRKQKRVEHIKNVKKFRRKVRKIKKKDKTMSLQKNKKNKTNLEPSEYVKTMRELWLPSKITNVRHSASRQILGYISRAGFSFSEALCCGLGYVSYNALNTLLKSGYNCVLIRNTTSKKYRIANFQIANL